MCLGSRQGLCGTWLISDQALLYFREHAVRPPVCLCRVYSSISSFWDFSRNVPVGGQGSFIGGKFGPFALRFCFNHHRLSSVMCFSKVLSEDRER